MKKDFETLIPVRLNVAHLIDRICDNIPPDEIAEFVKELDLRYADMGVTEELINVLMESVTGEFRHYKMEAEWKEKCEEVAGMLSYLDSPESYKMGPK